MDPLNIHIKVSREGVMIPGVQYCHTDSLTLGPCYITIMELALHQFLPLGREVPTALPFAPPLENNHTGGSSLLAPPQGSLLCSSVLLQGDFFNGFALKVLIVDESKIPTKK